MHERLHPDDIAALAETLAERLAGARREPALPKQLLPACAVAKLRPVSRQWLYDHKRRLGAVRLGDGPRPRLLFDVGRVDELLSTRALVPDVVSAPRSLTPRPGRRRSRVGVATTPSGSPLLIARAKAA